MPIQVTCECGRQLMAKDEFAGRQTQCPDCGRDLVIPMPRAGFGPAPEEMPFSKEPTTSGKAIASLVLGLVSILLCMNILTGIPAIILGILGLNEINRGYGRVGGKGMAITGLITGILGSVLMPIVLMLMVALLLPAVQATRGAAQRAQCTNNEKQILLAFHNFHDTMRRFPASAIRDQQGKPLLSWRVAILPYIEQQSLYDQFHLDEPWDSPHNKALIAQMPNIYLCPSEPPELRTRGLTTYQVIVSPGALFEDRVEDRPPGFPGDYGMRMADVTDGTSNTIALAESSQPVPWSKPDDPLANPNGPPSFGSKHPGGFNAGFADGSVKFIKDSINPQTLQALTTRNGGEVVGVDF